MRALLDTDAFCKLATAGLLQDAVRLLGVGLHECGRLPALPHMLRRGRLRKLLGEGTCDALIPLAESIPVAPRPGDHWLERLTPVTTVDPGEAQILAAAAEAGLVLVSDDKRALRALKDVPEFAEALAGHIVTIEALLIALCAQLGPEEVRRRVEVLIHLDKMLSICFSPGNPDPRSALVSYHVSLEAELRPLVLWRSGA